MTVNFGITLFPSKEIQDLANSYRKRYDDHYALIPPHITLKDSFHIPKDNYENVIAELRKIANETDPFQIEIKKVSSFAPVTNTIYLKIEPNEAINNLEDKLHNGIFKETRKHPFVPHVTLGRDLEHDEFTDILGRFNMEKINFKQKIDRFQLLYQLENDSWSVHETFVFGKE